MKMLMLEDFPQAVVNLEKIYRHHKETERWI